MTTWIALLRKAARERRAGNKERGYIISQHAFRRMGERGVAEEDITRCGLEGEVLENQDHGRDLKVLVQGVDAEGLDFYMVVALSFPRPVIVTVCRFQEEAWEDLGTFKKRR
ncbi:hypothetical protein SY88_10165 [Clostridiales bacterium PH28_bin88]|nr:hypothetical protein SY88_10165 [Clostridiales bacterium PH28_bin88]